MRVNILPVVEYPEEIFPLVEIDYSKELYENFKEYAYRLGNKIYIFGKGIRNFNPSQFSKLNGRNEEEKRAFSLLLRRLILYSIAETIEISNFLIVGNTKNTSKLMIQKKNPSLEVDRVRIYERLELQTIHWQDKNFGVIVNYKTVNEWTPEFKQQIGEEPCSYHNIRKRLSPQDANQLLKIQIPKLRRERERGRWRGDALKQKFEKTMELFKESVKWGSGIRIKEFELPTNGKIKISDEFVEVVPLGSENEYEILF